MMYASGFVLGATIIHLQDLPILNMYDCNSVMKLASTNQIVLSDVQK